MYSFRNKKEKKELEACSAYIMIYSYLGKCQQANEDVIILKILIEDKYMKHVESCQCMKNLF